MHELVEKVASLAAQLKEAELVVQQLDRQIKDLNKANEALRAENTELHNQTAKKSSK